MLLQVDLALLIGGGVATLIVYWFLRTLRWRVLLERGGVSVPLLDLYLCTSIALGFALITPFQSGEVVKVELLKKHGFLTRSPGYASFVVERAVDLGTVLTMAGISLVTTFDLLPHRTAYWLLAARGIGALAVAMIARRVRLSGPVGHLLDYFRECLDSPTSLLAVVALSLLSWTVVALAWMLILRSASIQLSLTQAIA